MKDKYKISVKFYLMIVAKLELPLNVETKEISKDINTEQTHTLLTTERY